MTIIFLVSCSYDHVNIFSAQFFESVPVSKKIDKTVCLNLVEVKNKNIIEYSKESNQLHIELTESEFQERQKEFVKIFSENILSYLKSKNIFSAIDLCEREKREYQLSIALEEYSITTHFPLHPVLSGVLLIPMFFITKESNLHIQFDFKKSETTIASVTRKDNRESSIFTKNYYISKSFYLDGYLNRQYKGDKIYIDYILHDAIDELSTKILSNKN